MQEIWMKAALELAHQAAREGEVPVGAVIVKKGQIIGSGYNRREMDQNPIAHAEILAVLSAASAEGSWRLVDCELYVTLEPCPMCLAALQQARVAKVFYGAIDLKGGALSLGYKLHEDMRTNHRFPVELLESSECEKVLKDFFRERRIEKKRV